MTKRVLITAGPVYGRLDDNKLVSNRVRGIWAVRFARHLYEQGFYITLIIPDTMGVDSDLENRYGFQIFRHSGFYDYERLCVEQAPRHSAAIMAAAVVNWIPSAPIRGKMPTKQYKPGDVIQVPFTLAPYVIDQMKKANPRLTLIGCKMLVGSEESELISAAYGVLLKAKCHAVVANDMAKGLKRKLIVNKDRSVQVFDDDFKGFYDTLVSLIHDDYYQTRLRSKPERESSPADQIFDGLVSKHQYRFLPVEGGRVFGALLVRCPKSKGWLVSPREKGEAFTADDAVLVLETDWLSLSLTVSGKIKASLNAPLLIRYSEEYNLDSVLHFHEQVSGLPTLPYAPPGTGRDSHRPLDKLDLSQGFNIEGHGCFLPGSTPC